jgi:hypothetical protein
LVPALARAAPRSRGERHGARAETCRFRELFRQLLEDLSLPVTLPSYLTPNAT